MPELAEVAFYCSQWRPGFNRTIRSVKLNDKVRCFRDVSTRQLSLKLKGNRLTGSRTHGKRMLFQLRNSTWLGVHLGMTGSLAFRKEEGAIETHDHLVLGVENGWLVFNDPRQFGKVELYVSKGLPEFWENLPREMESAPFDFGYFESILHRRGRSPLKSLLLDQSLFPGVGNWMADEVLWRARVRPNRSARSLERSELKALFRSLKFVCRGAMKYIATDFSDPPKSWLFTHRWKPGGRCPKTGVELERTQIGGRTTCWSAEWQK